MLQPVEIMSGFKNIRFVFRTKCKIRTSLSELALRFSVENDVLYVHDLEDHAKEMVLAFRDTYLQGGWKIRDIFETSGEKLIEEAINVDNQNPSVWLNEQYKLRDFMPFRFLK